MNKVKDILTEAFSKSMPHWLRGYLLHQMSSSNNSKVNSTKNGYDFNRYTPMSQKDHMISQLSRDEKPIQTLPLYVKLDNAGIDLTNAKFVNVPSPQDKNDPVLSKNDPMFDNRLFFYRLVWEDELTQLQKEQVWCRGMNDYEIFEARGKRERLGNLPTQTAVFYEYVEDICYIEDLASNKKDFTKLNQRVINKKYNNLELNDVDSEGEDVPITSSQVITRRFDPNSSVNIHGKDYYTDKSGYIKDWSEGLEKDLGDALSKAKFLKYASGYLPKKLKNPVLDIQKQLQEIFKMYKRGIALNITRFDNFDNLYRSGSYLSNMKECIQAAKTTLAWIDFMSDKDPETVDKFTSWLTNYNDYDSSRVICSRYDIDPDFAPQGRCNTIPYLQNQLNNFMNSCKDYFYSSISFPIKKDK